MLWCIDLQEDNDIFILQLTGKDRIRQETGTEKKLVLINENRYSNVSTMLGDL